MDPNKEGEWNKAAVMATNEDAVECKLSAVRCGYWADEALGHFATRRGERKAPVINRGHWARVMAVESTIRHFIAAGGRQVVVLGAGYDTAFVRTADARAAAAAAGGGGGGVRWWEIDLPEVVHSKAATIAASPVLCRLYLGCDNATAAIANAQKTKSTGASGGDGTGDADRVVAMQTETYVLASADLNEGGASLEKAVVGIDGRQGTLVVSECVLVYLEPERGDAVIEWAARRFGQGGVVFVTYEQIRPHDAFGAMMVRNIRERGCALRSVESYPEPADQVARYRRLGFARAAVADMNAVTATLLRSSGGVAGWLQRLEPFDEFEEWTLIQGHYCVVVAVLDSASLPPPLPSDSAATATSSTTNNGCGSGFRWPFDAVLPPFSVQLPPASSKPQQHHRHVPLA